MSRKTFALLFLLTPFFLGASSMDNNFAYPKKKPDEKDAEQKKKVKLDLYEGINKTLSSVEKGLCNPVLLLGPTGSGKSTTICSLLGVPLVGHYLPMLEENASDDESEAEFDDDDDKYGDETKESENGETPEGGNKKVITRFVIDVNHEKNAVKDYPEIGHRQAISETLYPKAYRLQGGVGQGNHLCDCPGFFDTRGGIERAMISLGNNMIIKSSEKIRGICLVTSYAAFGGGRAKVFMDSVIKALGVMFNGYYPRADFSKMKKADKLTEEMLNNDALSAVYLLFTKVPKGMKTKEIFQKVKGIQRELEKNNPQGQNTKAVDYLKRLLFYKHFRIINPLDEKANSTQNALKGFYGDAKKASLGIPSEAFSFIGSEQELKELGARFEKDIRLVGRLLSEVMEKLPAAIKKQGDHLDRMVLDKKEEESALKAAEKDKESKRLGYEKKMKEKEEAMKKEREELNKKREEEAKEEAEKLKKEQKKEAEALERRAKEDAKQKKAAGEMQIEIAYISIIGALEKTEHEEIKDLRKQKREIKVKGLCLDAEKTKLRNDETALQLIQMEISRIKGKKALISTKEEDEAVKKIDANIAKLDPEGKMTEVLKTWKDYELNKIGTVTFELPHAIESAEFSAGSGAKITTSRDSNRSKGSQISADYTNQTVTSKDVKSGYLWWKKTSKETSISKNDGEITLKATFQKKFETKTATLLKDYGDQKRELLAKIKKSKDALASLDRQLNIEQTKEITQKSVVESSREELERKKKSRSLENESAIEDLDDEIETVKLNYATKIKQRRQEKAAKIQALRQLSDNDLKEIDRKLAENKKKAAEESKVLAEKLEKQREAQQKHFEKRMAERKKELVEMMNAVGGSSAQSIKLFEKNLAKTSQSIAKEYQKLLALQKEQEEKGILIDKFEKKMDLVRKIQTYIPLKVEGIDRCLKQFQAWIDYKHQSQKTREENAKSYEVKYGAYLKLLPAPIHHEQAVAPNPPMEKAEMKEDVEG